jgi:hypothetical protein
VIKCIETHSQGGVSMDFVTQLPLMLNLYACYPTEESRGVVGWSVSICMLACKFLWQHHADNNRQLRSN